MKIPKEAKDELLELAKWSSDETIKRMEELKENGIVIKQLDGESHFKDIEEEERRRLERIIEKYGIKGW